MVTKVIDEYVDGLNQAQKEELLATQKRCMQMAQINQSLNEEMQRIEVEFNDSFVERKRSQETLNENARLQAFVSPSPLIIHMPPKHITCNIHP